MPGGSKRIIPPEGIMPGQAADRENQRLTLLGVTLIVLWFGLPAACTLILPIEIAIWLFFPLIVLLVIVISNLRTRVLRAELRSIEQRGYRVCLGCRYALTDLPEKGTCPECGEAYDPALLEHSWRWTYSRRGRTREAGETQNIQSKHKQV